MTTDEMKSYAEALVAGGPAKKAEVMAFMKAYLAAAAETPPQDRFREFAASVPPLPTSLMATEAAESLPQLPFEIARTDTGIHVPVAVNRFYTWREGMALVVKLAQALKR